MSISSGKSEPAARVRIIHPRRKIIALLTAAVVAAVCFILTLPGEQTFSVLEMDTVVTGTVTARGDSHSILCKAELTLLSMKIDRFLRDSAVYDLNKTAGEASDIYGDLPEWLEQIQDVQFASGGALDCTLGALSDLWDFGGDNPKVPAKAEIEKLLNGERGFTIINMLEEDGNGSIRTVGAMTSGKDAVLDLGAVGKGIACDALAKSFENAGWRYKPKRAVISVGGSILLWGKGDFRVGIRTPDGAAADTFAALTMPEGFVSTSGNYERYFEQDGVRYHHILDPKTGYPVQNGLSSVTVIAPTGLLSDALSTACFVLGYEKSKPLLEKYNAMAIFADETGAVQVLGTDVAKPATADGTVTLTPGKITLELTDSAYHWGDEAP